MTRHGMRYRIGRTLAWSAATVLCIQLVPRPVYAAESDRAIAEHLAELLRDARSVISANQAHINDPSIGEKGLTGAKVLEASLSAYRAHTGVDPSTLPAGRERRLLSAYMDAIVAVVNAHQTDINQKGVGFKGFIPAVFARLVNEEFARRDSGEARVKVTAPPDLVRNRKSWPDAWELETIRTKFATSSWRRGKPFAAVVSAHGGQEFRMAVPEYYGASCLSCHGSPKGSVDITGYPREGAKEGDLGGVISVTLSR